MHAIRSLFPRTHVNKPLFNDLLLLALMDVNEIAVKIYHIYDLAVTEILSNFTTKHLVF